MGSDLARRIQILLEDDLTGELLEHGRGETIRFGLDGQLYEIDLSGDSARALREALQPYVRAGRRVTAPDLRRAGATRSRTAGRIRDAATGR